MVFVDLWICFFCFIYLQHDREETDLKIWTLPCLLFWSSDAPRGVDVVCVCFFFLTKFVFG